MSEDNEKGSKVIILHFSLFLLAFFPGPIRVICLAANVGKSRGNERIGPISRHESIMRLTCESEMES